MTQLTEAAHVDVHHKYCTDGLRITVTDALSNARCGTVSERLISSLVPATERVRRAAPFSFTVRRALSR